MGQRILQLIGALWTAVYIVIIGAWKTTEFARLMAGNSHDLLLASMAALLFFGPFVAAELDPLSARPYIMKLTKAVLFVYLLTAMVVQSIDGTSLAIIEGMERERMQAVRSSVEEYEGARLRTLAEQYANLLKNGCRGAHRKNISGCDSLWRSYEEVLNVASASSVVEEETLINLKIRLKRRLEQVQELVRRLPREERVREEPPRFDLSIHTYGAIEIVQWTGAHSSDRRAQSLLAELGRNMMLLVLTILVGIWYQATAGKRRACLVRGPVN